MNKLFGIAILLAVLSAPCWAQSPYWTGDGGKGTSLTVLAPKGSNLAENESHLIEVVRLEFVSNFSDYSAISVTDWERLQDQYDVLYSGYYDDNAQAGLDLGHLTTTHMMGGNITKTSTGYALQMYITKSADKMTAASYSGNFTFAELDNRMGVRRASLELLQKMGVTLTAQAQQELAGAEAENRINAQTALARGITAQRQGTEVAALSYYFQAAAYDPSLREAASRSSILNVNVSSGNIGDDVRNDIQWYDDWKARLTETEQYFDSFNRTQSMPYTLFYTTEINQGTVNYENRTVTLSIETHLHGSGIWTVSLERALQAVYDGLDATKRKDTWGLAGWPQQGVTNLNAFARRSQNFSVVFELLNDRNQVIGRQTLQSGGSWELNRSGRPEISVNADVRRTLEFRNVNANDISDRMTIRVATVNGTDAETAARSGVLQIRASTTNEFDRNDRLRFSRGVIQGLSNEGSRWFRQRQEDLRKESKVPVLDLPSVIWGDPVISIGQDAFSQDAFRRNLDIHFVTIQNGVRSIGARAFYGHKLTSVTIPDSVISIGEAAFHTTVLSPGPGLDNITIGANVAMFENPFSYFGKYSDGKDYTENGFRGGYDRNGKMAGTYTNNLLGGWKLQSEGDQPSPR